MRKVKPVVATSAEDLAGVLGIPMLDGIHGVDAVIVCEGMRVRLEPGRPVT